MSKYIVTNFGKGQVIPTPLGDMRIDMNQTLELDDEDEDDALMLECFREWPHIHIEETADLDGDAEEDEEEEETVERRPLRRRVTKG